MSLSLKHKFYAAVIVVSVSVGLFYYYLALVESNGRLDAEIELRRQTIEKLEKELDAAKDSNKRLDEKIAKQETKIGEYEKELERLNTKKPEPPKPSATSEEAASRLRELGLKPFVLADVNHPIGLTIGDSDIAFMWGSEAKRAVILDKKIVLLESQKEEFKATIFDMKTRIAGGEYALSKCEELRVEDKKSIAALEKKVSKQATKSTLEKIGIGASALLSGYLIGKNLH